VPFVGLRGRASLVVGAAVFIIFLLVGVIGPFITPYDPNEIDIGNVLEGASLAHPLGTDELGRDVLSRVVSGARVSLILGLAATSLAALIGTVLGLIAGYLGKLVDDLIMRIVDLILIFPTILLSILLVAIIGQGLTNLIIAVSVAGIPSYARLIRAYVLSAKQQDYVIAVRLLGGSTQRILFKHVLPNGIGPLIINSTFLVPRAINDAATLGFLGIGVKPPQAEWGSMLAAAQAHFMTDQFLIFPPGIALFLVVIGLNLFGDGLRDIWDPRTGTALLRLRRPNTGATEVADAIPEEGRA
jgi:ABC-type dipeptide/oligopeptide/nickel transport system permease subunit